MTMNMETAPEQFDVEWETNFSRDKLQSAIPNRLQEIYDIIASRRHKVEPWFADLVTKMLLSVNRVCADLLKTMEQETVSGAAWNARDVLELWVWLKYCVASRDNARRFHEDSLRDMQGLTDALSKLSALRGIPNEFEASSRRKIANIAREKLGLDSLDCGYERVADAAKSVGLYDWFAGTTAFYRNLLIRRLASCWGSCTSQRRFGRCRRRSLRTDFTLLASA